MAFFGSGDWTLVLIEPPICNPCESTQLDRARWLAWTKLGPSLGSSTVVVIQRQLPSDWGMAWIEPSEIGTVA